MKNRFLIPLLLVGSISLTSCAITFKTSKEKFLKSFESVETNLSSMENTPSNVHINNNFNVNVYEYKEGEFFSYRLTAIILFIPIIQGKFTWKEDGKYYHAETHTDSSKNTFSEISEIEFNTYMEAHRQTIYDELRSTVDSVNALLDAEENGSPQYSSVSNSYRKLLFGGVEFKSKVTTGDSEEPHQYQFTYDFKNGLPKTYIKKDLDDKSSNKYVYKYGSARFTKPSVAEDSEEE